MIIVKGFVLRYRIAWLRLAMRAIRVSADVSMLVLAELVPGRRVSMGTVPEVTSGFSGLVR
jgi:hypothetical protein